MAENTMLRTVVVESVGEVKPRRDGKGNFQILHLQYNGQSGKFFWDLKNNQPLDWRRDKGKQYEFELQQAQSGKSWSASFPGAHGAPQGAPQGAQGQNDPFANGQQNQPAPAQQAPQNNYDKEKVDNINRTSALKLSVEAHCSDQGDNALSFIDEQGNIDQATLQSAQNLAERFFAYIQTGNIGYAGSRAEPESHPGDFVPPPEDDDIPF